VQSNILTPSFSPPGSETIDGAVNPFPAPIEDVGLHHRRLRIPMSEQFLHRANVIAIFQQVCGECLPEGVAVGRLDQSYCSGGRFDSALAP
jgi:hypothetical protein